MKRSLKNEQSEKKKRNSFQDDDRDKILREAFLCTPSKSGTYITPDFKLSSITSVREAIRHFESEICCALKTEEYRKKMSEIIEEGMRMKGTKCKNLKEVIDETNTKLGKPNDKIDIVENVTNDEQNQMNQTELNLEKYPKLNEINKKCDFKTMTIESIDKFEFELNSPNDIIQQCESLVNDISNKFGECPFGQDKYAVSAIKKLISDSRDSKKKSDSTHLAKSILIRTMNYYYFSVNPREVQLFEYNNQHQQLTNPQTQKYFSKTRNSSNLISRISHFVVENNLSENMGREILNMFNDCDGTNVFDGIKGDQKSIQSRFLSFGLFEENVISGYLRNCNYFSLSFDEVKDKVGTEKLIAVICDLSFPDGKTEKVLLDLISLKTATAKIIEETIVTVLTSYGLSEVDIKKKLVCIACDGGPTAESARIQLSRRFNAVDIHCFCHQLSLPCKKASLDDEYIQFIMELSSFLRSEKYHKSFVEYLKFHRAPLRDIPQYIDVRWTSVFRLISAVHKLFPFIFSFLKNEMISILKKGELENVVLIEQNFEQFKSDIENDIFIVNLL